MNRLDTPHHHCPHVGPWDAACATSKGPVMGWVEELPSGRFRGMARNALTGKKWSKAHDRWSERTRASGPPPEEPEQRASKPSPGGSFLSSPTEAKARRPFSELPPTCAPCLHPLHNTPAARRGDNRRSKSAGQKEVHGRISPCHRRRSVHQGRVFTVPIRLHAAP